MKTSELAWLASTGYKLPGESEYSFCKRLNAFFALRSGAVVCFAEDGLEGMILLNKDTLHATVVFRGTEELRDVIADLRTWPAKNLNGVGYVHRGIQHSLSDGWTAVLGLLMDMQPISVEFVGHSLGGMLATLAADWTYKYLPDLIITGVTTFGSPPVGSPLFGKSLDRALPDKVVNWVHCCDLVPRLVLPYLMGLQRPGKVLYLTSQGGVLDNPDWLYRFWDRMKACWSGRSLRLSLSHHASIGYVKALERVGL